MPIPGQRRPEPFSRCNGHRCSRLRSPVCGRGWMMFLFECSCANRSEKLRRLASSSQMRDIFFSSESLLARSLARSLVVALFPPFSSPYFSSSFPFLLPSLTTSFFVLSFVSFVFLGSLLNFFLSTPLSGPLLPTAPEASARCRPSPTQSR